MYPVSVAAIPNNPVDLALRSTFRKSCYTLAIAEMVISCVGLCFYWATFWITVVNSIVGISTCGVALNHYKDDEVLQNSTCCCGPFSAISTIKNMQICQIVLAVIGLFTTILSVWVHNRDGNTLFMWFAIIAIVFCIAHIVVSAFFLAKNAKLYTLCAADPAFVPPLPIMYNPQQAGYYNQPQPVAQAVPVYGVEMQPVQQQPAYAGTAPPPQSPPPGPYGLQQQQQQPQPRGNPDTGGVAGPPEKPPPETGYGQAQQQPQQGGYGQPQQQGREGAYRV